MNLKILAFLSSLESPKLKTIKQTKANKQTNKQMQTKLLFLGTFNFKFLFMHIVLLGYRAYGFGVF